MEKNNRTQINGTPAALFVEIVVMSGYRYCMDEGRGIYHHSADASVQQISRDYCNPDRCISSFHTDGHEKMGTDLFFHFVGKESRLTILLINRYEMIGKLFMIFFYHRGHRENILF